MNDRDQSIPSLILRAAKDEFRSVLRKGLAAAQRALDGNAPPHGSVPSTISITEVEDAPHKNVGEAIAATASAVSSVKSETMDRRKWAYLQSNAPAEMAVEFFGQPEGTITRTKLNSIGKRMVAVWMGPGGHGRERHEEPFKDTDGSEPDVG